MFRQIYFKNVIFSAKPSISFSRSSVFNPFVGIWLQRFSSQSTYFSESSFASKDFEKKRNYEKDGKFSKDPTQYGFDRNQRGGSGDRSSDRYGDRSGDRYGDRSGDRSGGERNFRRRDSRDSFRSTPFSFGRDSRPSQRPKYQDPIGHYTSFKTQFPYTEAPELKWSEMETLSPNIRDAMVKVFGYEKCTPVQSAILSKMPIENDILVQAKTGTGKTLAFLVPALEMIKEENMHPRGKETRILVVSPTRELALQISDEAKRLCKLSKFGVSCLVGGESKMMQIRTMERNRHDIVVGTPGRLLDCLDSESIVQKSLSTVDVLVLDEADRMLEIGFKEDIEKLVTFLPEGKKTFLFSATYPKNVKELVDTTLKPGYQVINTISPDDVSTLQTTAQSYHVSPIFEQMLQLHSIITRGLNSGEPFKCIVFWNTSKMTETMSRIFKQTGIRRIFELHSRKSQVYRNKVSQEFRTARTGILFTSDVSARGVDYPGVHLVVQMGAPSSKDLYVHRVGRTGRAGKEGQSIMFVSPFETPFVDSLNELPIQKANVCSERYYVEMDLLQAMEWEKNKVQENFLQAGAHIEVYDVEDAIISYFGFYMSQRDLFKHDRELGSKLHKELEGLSKFLGLEKMPPIPSQFNAMLNRESNVWSQRGSYRGGHRGSNFSSSRR